MTLWIRFRRLGTSSMLVAMMALVLHSGALAGPHRHGQASHGQGSSECQRMVVAGHGHQHVHGTTPDHGGAITGHHARAAATLALAADQRINAGPESSCCANACPVAVAPLSLETIAAPMTQARSLIPGSQRGSGIHPGLLKPPPRTISIA